MESTNTNTQTASSPSVTSESKTVKVFGHNLEDLVKVGIHHKAKNDHELEVQKAKDWKAMMDIFYRFLHFPAHVSNPKITNSWAIAHPDASEIKESYIDPQMLRLASQLEKSKDVKGMPIRLMFESPIFFEIEEQKDYMKRLVASLE